MTKFVAHRLTRQLYWFRTMVRRFVLLSLRFIFVSLQISTFCIDAKRANKALFSHRSVQNISLPFRFISLRSENDGALYSGPRHILLEKQDSFRPLRDDCEFHPWEKEEALFV